MSSKTSTGVLGRRGDGMTGGFTHCGGNSGNRRGGTPPQTDDTSFSGMAVLSAAVSAAFLAVFQSGSLRILNTLGIVPKTRPPEGIPETTETIVPPRSRLSIDRTLPPRNFGLKSGMTVTKSCLLSGTAHPFAAGWRDGNMNEIHNQPPRHERVSADLPTKRE